jgi:hypothetical protein
MKTLIYVPIIHTSADLGSLAKDVNKRGIADFGEEFWTRYREIVDSFWEAVSHYFDSIDVSGMKIYQDGMIAGGEVAQNIVDAVVKSGSKNFEIISKLIQRGAVLVKTEDLDLIKEERDRIVAILQAKSITRKLISFLRYKLVKKRLLNKRDKFIAKRIDETLNDNEKGLIFIGAFHNVKKRLRENFQIIEIKDTEKVNSFQKLIPFYKKNKKRFDELSDYLISKIDSNLYV